MKAGGRARNVHRQPISAASGTRDSCQTNEDRRRIGEMIHQDLSQIEGCPERGVKVTVYGLNPWNSLLAFGVDAGPVPNKADLEGLCDFFTERLKRLYEVTS